MSSIYRRNSISRLQRFSWSEISLGQKCHTANNITVFLEKMKIDASIVFISFQSLPAKFPGVSPLDYCAFGSLKKALSKRKPTPSDGLWKVVEEEL